jgi:hypothetical protein
MKKTLFTAALIAVASIGAANAMSAPSDQLVANAQSKINAFGLSIDAATLSTSQLVEIFAIDVNSDDSHALLTGRIAAAAAR